MRKRETTTSQRERGREELERRGGVRRTLRTSWRSWRRAGRSRPTCAPLRPGSWAGTRPRKESTKGPPSDLLMIKNKKNKNIDSKSLIN